MLAQRDLRLDGPRFESKAADAVYFPARRQGAPFGNK
jgi:hypothetical protein